MAVLFIDGFDKYGGPNNVYSTAYGPMPASSLLATGDWTSVSGNTQIINGLSSVGYAAATYGGSITNLVRTLSTNYTRLIGGFRFRTDLLNVIGFSLQDAGTAQVSGIVITTGQLQIRTGSTGGTVMATSSAVVAYGSIHYMEFDITIGASAAYQIWLDGQSVLSGTGNTRTTANNYANQLNLQFEAVDDVYLFDSTGTTNNAVLLNSPRVDTQFPVSDSSVQFGFGAAQLGQSGNRNISGFNAGANTITVRPFTPARSCTLNSISAIPGNTTGSIQLRPVVYTDVSGTPTTLMSAGSTVVGMTQNAILTMPLTTPQSLTAGTQYWLGYMSDTNINPVFYGQDPSVTYLGRYASATFSSGAPATAPAMTVGAVTPGVWGNVTGTGVNWYEVGTPQPNTPPIQNYSYVIDTVVGHEDLYGFSAASATITNVYAVAVKAYCARSDTGARTMSLRTHSGAVDDGGSLTGQTPPTSLGWVSSYWTTDPNGSIAWTVANLNAATGGFRIDT